MFKKLFGREASPYEPPFASLNHRAQLERRARHDPVRAQRLIDEDRYIRDNIDNGLF